MFSTEKPETRGEIRKIATTGCAVIGAISPFSRGRVSDKIAGVPLGASALGCYAHV